MSPEQWRGQDVGPAADVYSLGCVLYESLTGIVPFGRRAGDVEPEMPAGLDAVIERSVARDPSERYPSAGALIEAARERQGATPTATRVLSDGPEAPTRALRAGGARGPAPADPLALVGMAGDAGGIGSADRRPLPPARRQRRLGLLAGCGGNAAAPGGRR